MLINLRISRNLCIFAKWIDTDSYRVDKGNPTALPLCNIVGVYLNVGIMAKKVDYEDAMAMFKSKYGDTFDYSLVEDAYKGFSKKVPIICPTHGLFFISPSRHLSYNYGCPLCGHAHGGEKIKNKKKKRKLLFGVGLNDDVAIHANGTESMAFRKWRTMLARCYSKVYQKKQRTYKDCSVCEEWLTFSNFKKWHDEHYIDGYELDKDILVKGNKVYSSETCCYIPKEINSLLLKCDSKRGDLPIGVIRYTLKNGNVRYVAQFSSSLVSRRNNYLGSYDSPQKAFEAYKKAKEKYVKELASKYYLQNKINERVYNALMNYKVDIKD